jgi:hypothetical protein
MSKQVEELAAELGITAGEANALLTDDERAMVEKDNGTTAVHTNAQQINESAGVVMSADEKGRLETLGRDTAIEIEDAKRASDSVAKSLLLHRAQELVAQPGSAEPFLTGFAAGLKFRGVPDGVIKSRKTDAKAVIDAYARIVRDHLDEAREKLVNFTGGYHDFIVLARDIRGRAPTKATGDRAKRKLTATQEEKAIEYLKQMTPGQAASAAVVLESHLRGMPDGEIAVIRMLANVHLGPLTQSQDKGIAKWANDARDGAERILAAWEKSRTVRQVADHTAHGVLSVPQPAVAEQQQQAA